MKNVVLLASLLVISSHAFSAKPTGDAERGKALTATCAACHGADGNSAAPAFPKLAGLGEKYLYKQMKDIRDGARPVPTMVGQVDGKTDQELADMAAYYDSQARSGAQADPALVELGEKVYRAGVAERKVAACTACHSPNGQGNAPAGFPALAGQHAEYIAAQLRAYRKGYEDESGRTNDGDARIMRSNAFGLSDMEIEAVASYASGLK
jgi:cytochrome c553